jgi:hypothetical protein
MGVAIELDNLTTVEKIRVMESLWEDLCRNASETLSPSWHADVLAQREEAASVGEACAYSEPIPPLIPTQIVHPFRSNSATDSD